MTTSSTTLKVVLIGDGGVGKSSLMNRFITGKYDGESYHTIGVEFLNKTVIVDERKYTLQIWDTAGQERFKSLRTPFYRGADCCLLVFSLNDAQSFINLELWKSEFLFYANIDDEKFPFVVLGNKSDIELTERQVTDTQIAKWCKENGGYNYLETSAKDATNVEVCFQSAVRKTVLNQLHKGEASFSNISSDTPTVNLKTMAAANKKNNCC